MPKLEWETCCREQARLLGIHDDMYVKVMQGFMTVQEARAKAAELSSRSGGKSRKRARQGR